MSRITNQLIETTAGQTQNTWQLQKVKYDY